MLYKIPCTWTEYGVMEIEAENLGEAIQMAYDRQALPEGSYVEGSFDVDLSDLNLYNSKEVLAEYSPFMDGGNDDA